MKSRVSLMIAISVLASSFLFADSELAVHATYDPGDVRKASGDLRSMRVYEYNARKIRGEIVQGGYPWLLYAAEWDDHGRIVRVREENNSTRSWYGNMYPIDPLQIPALTSHAWIEYTYSGDSLSEVHAYSADGLYELKGNRSEAEGTPMLSLRGLVREVNPNTQIPGSQRGTSLVIAMDAQGRPITRAFSESGEENILEEFDYDSHNRIVRMTRRQGTEAETVRQYEYDDRGRVTAISTGNEASLFEFGPHGMTRHQFGNPERPNFIVEVEYNRAGFPVSVKKAYPAYGGEYLRDYSYETDERGNWTRRVTHLRDREGRGEPFVESYKVTRREIDYR